MLMKSSSRCCIQNIVSVLKEFIAFVARNKLLIDLILFSNISIPVSFVYDQNLSWV